MRVPEIFSLLHNSFYELDKMPDLDLLEEAFHAPTLDAESQDSSEPDSRSDEEESQDQAKEGLPSLPCSLEQ